MRSGRDSVDAAAGHDVVALSQLLWTKPARLVTDPDAATRQRAEIIDEFVMIARSGEVRFLVPLASPRVAGMSISQTHDGLTWLDRCVRRAAAHAFDAGIAQRVLRRRLVIACDPGRRADAIASSILPRVGEVFGCPDVLVSVGVGTVRANRKPVLQVFSDEGERLGYLKVGWNGLTRRLVRNEALALSAAAHESFTRVRPPQLIEHWHWHDLELLAISRVSGRNMSSRSRTKMPLAAMREVAAGRGGYQRLALAGSPYWQQLKSRLDALGLHRAARAVNERRGAVELPFGTWHGDWTPWNMESAGEQIRLWDWERWARTVPVGFDALHFQFQVELNVKRNDAALSVSNTRARAASLLDAFGADPTDANLIFLLYLVELYLRYRELSLEPMGQSLAMVAGALRITIEHEAETL